MALVCATFTGPELNTIAAGAHGVACHVATFARLHQAEFGSLPTHDKVTDMKPQVFMSGMLELGKRLTKPFFSQCLVTTNSVILFEYNETAVHSCIARDHKTLGGYNQTTFFESKGVVHGYSEHDTSALVWDSGRKNVSSSVAHACVMDGKHFKMTASKFGMLVEVPELVARAYLRSKVQRT